MDLQHCEKFGFDEKNLRQRLRQTALSKNDHPHAARLQEVVIAPAGSTIIDQYFQELLQWPPMRAQWKDSAALQQEKDRQTRLLLSLGIGFDRLDYFDERLQLGAYYASVGVPMALYICAAQTLVRTIAGQIPRGVAAYSDEHLVLRDFLDKISALDMSLVVDAYYASQFKSLQQSLGGMQVLAGHLEQQAITDSLTGMVNHKHVFGELRKNLRKAQSEKTPLCVVMADIDHFKKVNDSYGHLAGDGVLKEVATRIKSSLRNFDTVGRYGGEEFLLILNNANLSTAKAVAERIRSRIVATPIDLPEVLLDVTISMGVALAEKGDSAESLVERADKALYNAKNNGRNQVAVAE